MNPALETLYALAPVWLQNLGISLYGLGWRHQRFGGPFPQYVREFRERETWPADRFQRYLENELRTVLTRAFAETPYYRTAWGAAGFVARDLAGLTLADLARLPITPKSDLRARPREFLSRVVRRRHRVHRYDTSGTTGTPITTYCTSDAHRRFMAAREARSLGWAGASLLNPRSMIGGRIVAPPGTDGPPFHRYNRAERQIYLSAFHISPANLTHYLDALNRHRPTVLTGYAHSHYLLARLMLARGVSLDYVPDALVLGSEKLTAEMKSVLARAFRARAYEEYGCVENCVLATECPHGRLHVSPDFGLVEIVDAAGRATPPGVVGRLLCTSLLNPAQPLVRYELGDLGAWAGEPCPCGRHHLPVLRDLVGRLEDTATGPDGRQLVRFHGLFVGLPHVAEGQVIQETVDRFTVRVVASERFNARDEARIRGRLVQRVGRVHLRVERVAAIPRTERGKFRAVISRVKDTVPPA